MKKFYFSLIIAAMAAVSMNAEPVQQDIALTDSALQAVTAQMQAETRIYERNMLGVKKDSLQVRYEALIGEVRIIRKRMEESPQNRE